MPRRVRNAELVVCPQTGTSQQQGQTTSSRHHTPPTPEQVSPGPTNTADQDEWKGPHRTVLEPGTRALRRLGLIDYPAAT